MNETTTKQPLKKRSLSSYLSNVSTRREELEKISKQETSEEEDTASRHEQRETLSEEVNDKLPENGASFRSQTTSVHQATQNNLNAKESEDLVHKNDASSHEGEVNGDNRPDDVPETNEKISQAIRAKISSSSSSPNVRNVDIQNHQSFSRDQLRAMLKEPKRKTVDDFIEEEGLGAVEEEDLSDEVLEKNTTEPENEEKDIEYSDSDKDTDDVGSDDPTAPNSPIKLGRRKLVRGDQLDATTSSMFNNESDSELSDIDDSKNIALSSSLFRGGSSPVKETNNNLSNMNSSPAQNPKRGSVSRSNDSNKSSHIAVSKRPKQKKGIYRDSGGRTRLQIACDKGKYDVVKKMIEEGGYDINDQDNAGNTALHEAALQGHIEIVELLIENGADVNIKSIEMFGDTPLIDASANGHLDVVKYLLKNGADPTIRNAKGLTAFESVDDESEFDDEEDQKILREIKKKVEYSR